MKTPRPGLRLCWECHNPIRRNWYVTVTPRMSFVMNSVQDKICHVICGQNVVDRQPHLYKIKETV